MKFSFFIPFSVGAHCRQPAKSFLPHALLACLFAVCLSECGKRTTATDPVAEPSSVPTSVLALPTPSTTPLGSQSAAGIVTLMGRLAREASNRPKVSPTADDVLATLDKLGATIPNKQQSLADTYKANYCLGGYTLDGAFALSTCEYADAAAAEAGRTLSSQILARMPTRDVWSHKDATLAVVQLKADDATTARKKKLVAAFLAL